MKTNRDDLARTLYIVSKRRQVPWEQLVGKTEWRDIADAVLAAGWRNVGENEVAVNRNDLTLAIGAMDAVSAIRPNSILHDVVQSLYAALKDTPDDRATRFPRPDAVHPAPRVPLADVGADLGGATGLLPGEGRCADC